MSSYLEVNSKCISCDNCRLLCPEDAFWVKNQKYVIDHFACTRCEICISVCPTDAIWILDPSKKESNDGRQ